MTSEVGASLWRVGVDTSKVDSSLSSTAAKSKQLGDATERAFSGRATTAMGRFGGALDGLGRKFTGLGTSLKQPAVANGLLQGVGLGAGLFAFQSITSVITGLVGQFGDLVKAGAAQQVVDDRLAKTVQDNVGNYSDYADAIDRAVSSGVRLAFTDDEQKNALSGLIVRTHDVKKALSDLAIAEDLARGRNISLSDAAGLVGKAVSGQVGALRRAGLAIDKNATATQALAAIQEAYSGQAETFAKTDTGRWAAIQARIDQLRDDIGQKLQPVLEVALQTISEILNPTPPTVNAALDTLIRQAENLKGVSGNANVGVTTLSDSLQNLVDQAGPAAVSLLNFGQTALAGKSDLAVLNILLSDLGEKAGLSANDVETLSQAVLAGNITLDQAVGILKKLDAQYAQHQRQLEKTASSGDDFAKAYHDRMAEMAADTKTGLGGATNALRNFTSAWRGDWINVVNRIDLAAGNIHQTLAGMKKDTNQQLKQLEYDLAHPHQKEKTLAYLVKQMKRAQADLIKAENSGDADLIKEAQDAVAAIQAQYDKLNGSVTLTTHFTWKGGEGTGSRGPGGGPGRRASGGPIWPGDWLVGENGPERIRINRNGTGYVTPHAGGSSSIGNITVNVMGSVAAGEGQAMGQSIVSELLRAMKRQATLPLGAS